MKLHFLDLTDVVGGRSKDDDIVVGDILVVGNNEERLKVLETDTTLNRYKVSKTKWYYKHIIMLVKEYRLIKKDLRFQLVLILT